MSFRKSIAAITAAVMLSSAFMIPVLADEPVMYGDINHDGKIDVNDVSFLKDTLIKDEGIYDDYSDVNFDGMVNLYDLLLMKQYVMGKIDSFPNIPDPPMTSEATETSKPPQTFLEVTETSEPPQTSDEATETSEPPQTSLEVTETSETPEKPVITLDDVPQDYVYALDWIWTNRIDREKSTQRRNTVFDQIVAGKGSINYVIRWQSYKTISYEQRQKLEQILDETINGWNNYLAGYENWPYDHIDVKITGWAVIDKSVILDPHDDEIIYDNLHEAYDSTYDTSNGYEEIPNILPSAPDELSRFYHFSNNIGYDYPGGLDKRFDMYLWATQGFPAIGGCGGDWGQRLSDDAYLNIINSGQGIHVLQHEVGHGFGLTDFYGGEGEQDGFPPGGFPGGENSLMMAGSAAKITDFDGWMLRYMWSKIKDEDGRFNFN